MRFLYLFSTKVDFFFFLHQQEVKFPAVTICNQNAIKDNEIPDHYIDDIFKEIYEVLDEEMKSDEKDPGNVRRHDCLDVLVRLKLSFHVKFYSYRTSN